ncbi:hypothetical protein ACFPRL_30435 [Pseudoclavibacter helvolus]
MTVLPMSATVSPRRARKSYASASWCLASSPWSHAIPPSGRLRPSARPRSISARTPSPRRCPGVGARRLRRPVRGTRGRP